MRKHVLRRGCTLSPGENDMANAASRLFLLLREPAEPMHQRKPVKPEYFPASQEADKNDDYAGQLQEVKSGDGTAEPH